ILRARSGGLVKEITVRSGEFVRQGQPLARIENRQLELELRDLELEIAQAELRLRTLRNQEKLAAAQAEMAQLQNLYERLEVRRDEVAHLEILAPEDGLILTPHPEQLVGTYVKQGEEVLALGDESHKELVLSIDQQNVDSFQASLGKPVQSRLTNLQRLPGMMNRIAPAASVVPTHDAFCATSGGPVPVRASESNGSASVQFIEPRFEAAVQLDPELSRQLFAGQRAVVWPATGSPSLATGLCRGIAAWWRERTKS
ncbi:MAG: hypothetical protein RIS70_249, partial [Planctomycetota bacterium]